MRSRRSGLGGLLAIGVAIGAILSGAPAQALTLGDLDAGDSITSLDGSLVFSEFSVAISGDLNPDLTQYAVVQLGEGFRVNGAIAAADGASGTLDITYTATAMGPLQITGARIFFNAAVVGESAAAVTMEDLLTESSGAMVGELDVLVDGAGTSDKEDTTVFSELGSLYVDKSILVDSTGAIAVTLSVIDQTFTVIPEPATAALLATGLMGLAASRPRSRTLP